MVECTLFKKSLFLLLFVFAISANSQKFSGKATYQIKAVSYENMIKMYSGGRSISKENRVSLMEAVKDGFERTYTLDFNENLSLYKKIEKLRTNNISFSISSTSEEISTIFMDIKNEKFTKSNLFMGKKFLIKGELKKPIWKLGKESKKIGDYLCFKATTTKTVPNKALKDDKDAPKTEKIEVIAWYTTKIPISQGPNMYHGLPGLIMELTEGNTIYICDKISIKAGKTKNIKPPTRGKKVSQEEYIALVSKKKKQLNKNKSKGVNVISTSSVRFVRSN